MLVKVKLLHLNVSSIFCQSDALSLNYESIFSSYWSSNQKVKELITLSYQLTLLIY